MSNSEESRLDKKIAAEKLLADINPLWDDLFASAEATRDKLRDSLARECAVVLNDRGTVIRVKYSERSPSLLGAIESTLEMRLNRDSKKLTAAISRQGSSQAIATKEPPIVYAITADIETGSLRFSDKQTHYSPVELAEHLIAEGLMKMVL